MNKRERDYNIVKVYGILHVFVFKNMKHFDYMLQDFILNKIVIKVRQNILK